jgi:hypothetical protein
MSDPPQDLPEPPYIQLAREALETSAGRATITLLVAQHAAVHGALELNRLPTSDGVSGAPDVMAALDAVVDSGGWVAVGKGAIRDSDDPAALVRDATKSYMQNLRLLCNHVLTRRRTLGVDTAIDPGTLALAASDPSLGIAQMVTSAPEPS